MDRIRFGGLASGFDTQSIVENLMRAERLPFDKIKQQKQALQWKLEDYRSVNTKLSTFRDSLLNMRLQSTFTSKTVASSDTSKITATANSSAGNVSYTFDKVTALATAATNNSADKISADGIKLDSTQSISSQRDVFDGLTFHATAVKVGTAVTDKIEVKTTGTDFRLSNMSAGGEVQFGANPPVIKVNGDARNLITSATAELGDNDVRLLKNGNLEFGKALAVNDEIQVDYNYLQVDTVRTNSTPTSQLQLRQHGFVNSVDVPAKIKTFSYTTNASGQRTYGAEKNWSQGTITPGDSFETAVGKLENDEYLVDNEGKIHFGEQLAANTELRATYAHEYAKASVEVHREAGSEVKEFKFDGNLTLDQVISRVNSANIGINMFYDKQADKVAVTRTETGNFNDNSTEGVPDTAKEMIFGNDFFGSALKLDSAGEINGTNAQFTMNGLKTERSSNAFTVNGMSFTLKGTFDSTNNSGDNSVSITSSNDTDNALENIKKFVEEYNTLIDEMNGKLREEVNRDYKPLTDEQRESLSEKEIEKWEEEARKGNLRNDQYLRSAIDGMRSRFYESVNTGGAFSNLTQIGITTTRNYMDGGKLEINEDKLREALETDADSVYQLFAADGEGNRGIARTIGDTVSTTITRITDHAGNGIRTNQSFTLGRNLDDIDSRISNFERRLQSTEDRYWKQFAAFEKAMQQQNDQLSYMLSQLGMNQQQ
ncbi:flagellar filament capping protein FliD [Jeotgalibacillus sp. R-1-5s-1]|uniref:flagellar filament capping protein FliD n=1 Tax=Jeotgalibacillus sp. R-1-5s-1 TaxID=2555897 RepID=UPI00141AE6F2|nr:flagellar filament capping protein FliD [Jeotgalibacillus sp. R-1-5s-1]